MMMTTTPDLVWNAGTGNGTCLQGWLDLPSTYDVNTAIATLEAAAGTKGDWDLNEYGGHDWWGLTGTFKGNFHGLHTQVRHAQDRRAGRIVCRRRRKPRRHRPQGRTAGGDSARTRAARLDVAGRTGERQNGVTDDAEADADGAK